MKRIKTLTAMLGGISLASSMAYADYLTHTNSLCNQKVYIQSQLNGQHIAPNGTSINLTTTVDRRIIFTVGCDFNDDEFTFATSEDGKSNFLYAESEAQLLTDRTYPGTSGKWKLDKQTDGTIGIVSLKFPGQYLSVDASEYFSLVDPSNSGLLANEKFKLSVISGDNSGDTGDTGGNDSSASGTYRWSDFDLDVLSVSRLEKGDYQPIKISDSQVGTTELLILAASHGNPTDQTKRNLAADVRGGGWTKLIDAGNDDKSVEIWSRLVTSSNKDNPGTIDTKNAAAKLAVLTYGGQLKTGNAVGDRLFNETVAIDGKGTGPYFLVVAASDNGGSSDLANAEFASSDGDDVTWIYLTKDRTFEDRTAGKRRGAIASIELK